MNKDDIEYDKLIEDNEKNIKKVSLKLNDSNYLLKIYLPYEKNSIIFKLEQENNQTFLYFEKFFLADFRKKNRTFYSDINISGIFPHLKKIIDKSEITLDNQGINMNLIITNKTDNYTLDFLLNKIILSQNKLNSRLYEKIEESEDIINFLNNEVSKLTKALELKTNIVNELKKEVNDINKCLKDININNNNKNINNNKNNNISNKKEEEKIINKTPEKEKKETSESTVQKKDTDNKRFISNSHRRNSKKKKYFYANNQKPNNQNLNNKSAEDNSIFCFENVEIIGNKKIFDLLVTFNLIMILIILCLIGSIYSIQSNLEFEKAIEEEFMNKLSYLNALNEYAEEEQNQRENYKEYSQGNSLFDNERQKIYFKEEIISQVNNNVKDVDFILKYKSSRDTKKFDAFYNICKDIEDSALLIKNEKGEKFVLLSKYTAKVLKTNKIEDLKGKQKYFSMYNIDKYDIYEYDFTGNLKEVYNTLIKAISNFFKDNYDTGDFEMKFFGKIKEINAFELKYIK